MIEVRNLIVCSKKQKLLKSINISLKQEKVIGITGKSGAGKSTLIKAIMGALGQGLRIESGDILIDNESLLGLKHTKRRKLCGTTIGFIPQNPMTAFDPRLKIGQQMLETLCVKLKINKKQAKELGAEMLYKVNLLEAQRVFKSYPCQLSGGMLQRVAAALLLGLNPTYILADEPTSALDELNREILIKILKKQSRKSGILFISHDVDALSQLCEKVYIMEEGSITEGGNMRNLLSNPKGDWTKEFAKANKKQNRSEWQWKELEL
jgi:ABC-type dipeptide/oligopeptide/nickel transport system ATPase component